MGRTQHEGIGYGRSDKLSFTIGNGATGALVAAVDLGRNYAYLLVKCENCQYIPSTTTLKANVGYADDDALSALKERDDPGTEWVSGNLPTSGSLAFALVHALGAQRIQFVLSKAASGGAVVFDVYGILAGIDG